MITVAEAQRLIAEHIDPLPPVTVATPDALQLVLAEDVAAPAELPAFDNSAMDGYAVLAADTAGASETAPVTLRVARTIPAGSLPVGPLRPGQAARILTGAPVPPGADAVVMQEEVRREGNSIIFARPAQPGRHIRRRGEDVRQGDICLARGKVVRPAEIGLLIALNVTRVTVIPRPKVGILCTGDELVESGQELTDGQIYNSNAYTLAAQVVAAGGNPVPLGLARDDPDEIRRKIENGLATELLVISGGVSVGDRDYVKEVLQALGMETKFWRVRMKPGKPLLFGLLKGCPVVGLPGNPAASLMAFDNFVLPAIFRRRGIESPTFRVVRARLEADLPAKPGHTAFVRVALRRAGDGYQARPAGSQSAGIMSSLVRADGCVVVPPDAAACRAGDEVEVRVPHDWLG